MLAVIFIIIFAIAIWSLIIYNLSIKKYNEVDHTKSVLDVYLNERFSLIPNLVDCVKAYMEHEKNSLNELLILRNAFLANKDFETALRLESKINDFMLVVENYPELKANEQFIVLEKKLIETENKVQSGRKIYNNIVEDYNDHISVFPNNLIAKLFQFEKAEIFQMEEIDG